MPRPPPDEPSAGNSDGYWTLLVLCGDCGQPFYMDTARNEEREVRVALEVASGRIARGCLVHPGVNTSLLKEWTPWSASAATSKEPFAPSAGAVPSAASGKA